MDRLLALQAFARVVELGGFTKAGDSLQLSKALRCCGPKRCVHSAKTSHEATGPQRVHDVHA